MTIAVIIGAMKSGTTSLYNALAVHRDVARHTVKEPDFFSLGAGRDGKYEQSVGHYLSRFLGSGRVQLEASTSYTKYPMFGDVPRRMAESGLDFKLIYVVRDPFKRIESEYLHSLVEGDGAPLFFGVGAWPLFGSNYHLQLSQYRPYFELKDILVLKFEELVADPIAQLAKVAIHLDLDPSGFGQFKHDHSSDFRYETVKEKWPLEKIHINKSRRHLVLERPGSLYKLSPQHRERVNRYLEADMRVFSQEYGIDISDWGWK